MADHIIIEHHYTIINKQTKQNKTIISSQLYIWYSFTNLDLRKLPSRLFPSKTQSTTSEDQEKKKEKKDQTSEMKAVYLITN